MNICKHKIDSNENIQVMRYATQEVSSNLRTKRFWKVRVLNRNALCVKCKVYSCIVYIRDINRSTCCNHDNDSYINLSVFYFIYLIFERVFEIFLEISTCSCNAFHFSCEALLLATRMRVK